MNRGIRVLMLSVAMLALLATTGTVRADGAGDQEVALLKDTGRAFSRVAKQAVPAVVFITVEKTVEARQPGLRLNDPFGFFGIPQPQQPQKQLMRGQGSGFIITKDGYILTNNHVVGDADKIMVKLNDGREFEAKQIGTDPRSEVAVIKIDSDDDLPFLQPGDSRALEIGEWVIAVGNPFGLSESVTVGVVSAKGRQIGLTSGRDEYGREVAGYEDFIQTDAAINPGNSGGPLLNIDGKVVGINTAIYSQDGGYMGIGFAIPIDLAVLIKDQLVAHGKVTRGYLGIQLNPEEVTDEMAQSFGLEDAGGVLVAEVVPDSPAQQAGLLAGDIILEMDGQTVDSNQSFRNTIALIPPGTEVKLNVYRDNATELLTVTIGTLPGDEEAQQAAGEVTKKLGFEIHELTPDLAKKFGYEDDQGVLVANVEPYSVAAQAEIRPGTLILSVDRTPVTNIKEFSEAIGKAAQEGRVLLRVKNQRFSWYALLRFE